MVTVARAVLEGHISRLIQRMKEMKGSIQETAPIGIISMDNWEWPQGVALFALYSYYRETGDEGIMENLTRWFDSKLDGGIPAKNVNTMCPMLTLSYLAKRASEQNERYKYL
ncbi:glycoside hydrolase family 88 protein [Paenibacillus sp. P46E]|uniref:glycoside hydrolase family 88 protein n=1 Tax=Paenibacillus sp. P46E TaxID=1349436 RepID=UPI00093E36E5|nr:glycoside hydrolase family 88 protein [Paenibacillus sp. P46E]OKP98748.1 hypothetical protein A3849_08350 [Paenibacillus sp. P46E]